ncbi:MAG: hypothetical protein ACR2NF_00425 [Pirellulales bacterium]
MKVKLIKPFGIYSENDVIEVRSSVADLWIKNRMVIEADKDAPVTRPPQESASVEYRHKGK